MQLIIHIDIHNHTYFVQILIKLAIKTPLCSRARSLWTSFALRVSKSNGRCSVRGGLSPRLDDETRRCRWNCIWHRIYAGLPHLGNAQRCQIAG